MVKTSSVCDVCWKTIPRAAHLIVRAFAGELGYLPSEPLLKHWKEVAPRKVFFLHGVGTSVPLKEIIASEILENITCFEPEAPQPTRCLDWFAPEVGFMAELALQLTLWACFGMPASELPVYPH
jgi:hypothetical protein